MYLAKDISNTNDSEDFFAFPPDYYTYKAISKRAHRELDLSVRGGSSKPSKVDLMRQYDQSLTDTFIWLLTAKIWSGAFHFHEWAKNESLIAIAPKGLGNGKPIVSLW